MQYPLDEPADTLCARLHQRIDDDPRLDRACALAAEVWDGNTTRARGPRAALELAELGADRDSLVAAVLADPRLVGHLDDAAMAREFGESVAEMVADLQRLTVLGEQYRQRDQGGDADRMEKLRRLLLTEIRDIRVMLVQLVHRLERLRGLPAVADEEERRQIAAETLDLYAPIAHRLGLGQLKWELEDLAFRHLEPAIYKRIAKLLDERRVERESYLVELRAHLARLLKDAGIKAKVYGRPKHIYSIWGKMRRKRLDFDQLFDVRALRIEVETVEDCYAALSVVHEHFDPITSEYDDYIARPKENGYQSLHTAVHAFEGKVVEVQIRTRAMHEQAELGVAAHWRYKEGAKGGVVSFQEDLERLRQALAQGETGALSGQTVYVFTPQGDIKEMERGDTVLDFAYDIHSNIGHRCKGARINGRIVPLSTQLENADQVEILTGTEPAPNREWALASSGFLHSSSARAKVRNWFNKIDRRDERAAGREQCDRLFRRLGLSREQRQHVVEALGCKSEEALHEAVGANRIGRVQLLEAARGQRAAAAHPEQAEPTTAAALAPKVSSAGGGFSLDGLKAQPARCCLPRPGEPVVAFITRGQGLKLHRPDCRNLAHLREQYPDRVIEVEWPADKAHWTERLRVAVLAEDSERLWADIGQALAQSRARLLESRSRRDRNTGLLDVDLQLELPAGSDGRLVVERLRGLKLVTTAERTA